MEGGQSANVLISVVSPLLGLLIVAFVFWVDSLARNPPRSEISVVIVGLLFFLSWGLGVLILARAVNQLWDAGIVSSLARVWILAFLLLISNIIAALSVSGFLTSTGRT